MARIKIPSQLRGQTDGLSEVQADGVTIGQVLQALVDKYPKLKDRIYDESGKLRRYVNIYLGDEDIRFMDFLETKVEENTELSLVPAIAGGVGC